MYEVPLYFASSNTHNMTAGSKIKHATGRCDWLRCLDCGSIHWRLELIATTLGNPAILTSYLLSLSVLGICWRGLPQYVHRKGSTASDGDSTRGAHVVDPLPRAATSTNGSITMYAAQLLGVFSHEDIEVSWWSRW